jgi:hypothetical protein
MKKAWEWLKKAGVWIAGLLALLVGVGWLWRRYESKLGALKDELAVKEATTAIEVLRAQRAEVVKQVGERDAAVVLLNGKIEVQKRKLVEAYEGGKELTDGEVDDELRRLGIL